MAERASPARDRSAYYRERGVTVRAKAAEMADEGLRVTMLEVAATWDRLADMEEKLAERPLPTHT
jgi:hypothetical protein